MIDTIKREISGVIPIKPDGSKEARASAVSAMAESEHVHLPSLELHKWVADFIEEVCNFPNAKYDDQVDAMTQALKRLEGRTAMFAPFVGYSAGYSNRPSFPPLDPHRFAAGRLRGQW